MVVKDARSASWYRNNRSHIMLYVRYTKWINTAKGIENFHVKMFFLEHNCKTTTTTTISKHNRDSKPEHLVPQTEALPNTSIEVILFNCLSVMGRYISKQNQFSGPHVLNKVVFPVLFNVHDWLYLEIYHIYGSMIYCTSMVKK